MKRFFTSVKQQAGFTLIELMVVVAIIGLLSAVAIPNFKKYQAKSKVTEAKLQLSAIYTAESAFYSDYNMYASCLSYMGYDPSTEVASRYYAMGFSAGTVAIAAAAVTSAVNSGLNTAAPTTTGCDVSATLTANKQWFAAGKGSGAVIVNTTALMITNLAGAALAAANCINTSVITDFGTCVNDQSLAANMTWQASAIGIVSADFATAPLASGLNINERKLLKTPVQGY